MINGVAGIESIVVDTDKRPVDFMLDGATHNASDTRGSMHESECMAVKVIFVFVVDARKEIVVDVVDRGLRDG